MAARKKTLAEQYLQYLRLERNFSPNTQEAYCRDLDKLLLFLQSGGISPLDCKLEDLQQFKMKMEKIFGINSCHVLSVRSAGSCEVLLG